MHFCFLILIFFIGRNHIFVPTCCAFSVIRTRSFSAFYFSLSPVGLEEVRLEQAMKEWIILLRGHS